MGSHNAAGQMLGYLYQVRYALNLLLENELLQFEFDAREKEYHNIL